MMLIRHKPSSWIQKNKQEVSRTLILPLKLVFSYHGVNIFQVSPIYYVFFTIFVMIASGILYGEFSSMTWFNLLGLFSGFSTIIIAVFMLHLFKVILQSICPTKFLKDNLNVLFPTVVKMGILKAPLQRWPCLDKTWLDKCKVVTLNAPETVRSGFFVTGIGDNHF